MVPVERGGRRGREGEGEEGEREREERGERRGREEREGKEGGIRGREEREGGEEGEEGGSRREWGRMRRERRYVNGSSFRPAVSVTGVCVCGVILSHLLTTPDITLWMTLEVSATEEEKETVKAFMQYNLLYSCAQRARRLETEVY